MKQLCSEIIHLSFIGAQGHCPLFICDHRIRLKFCFAITDENGIWNIYLNPNIEIFHFLKYFVKSE
jgi:hypothetical protein